MHSCRKVAFTSLRFTGSAYSVRPSAVLPKQLLPVTPSIMHSTMLGTAPAHTALSNLWRPDAAAQAKFVHHALLSQHMLGGIVYVATANPTNTCGVPEQAVDVDGVYVLRWPYTCCSSPLGQAHETQAARSHTHVLQTVLPTNCMSYPPVGSQNRLSSVSCSSTAHCSHRKPPLAS